MWCKRSTTLDSIFIVDPPLRSHTPTSTFASLTPTKRPKTSWSISTFRSSCMLGIRFRTPMLSLRAPIQRFTFRNAEQLRSRLELTGHVCQRFDLREVHAAFRHQLNWELRISLHRHPLNPSHFRKANPVPHSWPSGENPVSLFTPLRSQMDTPRFETTLALSSPTLILPQTPPDL